MSPRPLHIIGHGLAGAILAETASRKGIPIRVTHDNGSASSRVAAGLFTPLTGRRLIPSWALEQALPVVRRFYPSLEQELETSFYEEKPTCRILRSEEQRKELEQRPSDWVKDWQASPPPFHSGYGVIEVTGGGWVNLPKMLDALEAKRQQQDQWNRAPLPDERTVWCQGVQAATSDLWKDVGWRIAYGDVLTVRIPDLDPSYIYNFDKFLLPIGNQLFRCGATYDWHTLEPVPRAKGRQEIESALQSCLTCPYEVVDHQAGLRPVALARVPVAGPHPEEPDQWIFNGFASKGVLLAPWMAEGLLHEMETGNGLPPETRAAKRIQRQRDREKTRIGQMKKKSSPTQ